MNHISTALVVVLLGGVAMADGAKLTVRVLDKDTGKAIPARVAIAGSDGKYVDDRMACSAQQWPNIESHGTFIDGSATFDMPAGKATVTAGAGMEYEAQSKDVELADGKTAEVEFKLARVVDMRGRGWVAGDAHMHMVHGENQRKTSYRDVAVTCAANGLHFCYVNEEYVGAGTVPLTDLQKQADAACPAGFRMFIGEERPKNIVGHMAIIGVSDPFVISQEAPYLEGERQVREQGGVSYYVHPARYFPDKQYQGKWLDLPGNNLGRELVFDALCGPSFDAVSIISDEPGKAYLHNLYFNLLNRRLFVPVMADSDACFDRPTLGLHTPGFWTTYFHIGAGKEVTGRALAEAVRAGRTFATTGPLVLFEVDGQLPGATLPPDGAERKVRIDVFYPQHAWSLSKTTRDGKDNQIERLELVRNGKVIQTWTNLGAKSTQETTIRENEESWYLVRAYGSDQNWQVAMTSPVYFAKAAAAGKRKPFVSTVRGRLYDFQTGKPCAGTVEVARDGKTIKQFEADGQFIVKMPVDATITVRGKDGDAGAVTHDLLMDYGPTHRFLWQLDTKAMGEADTFARLEGILGKVDLEFPLGYRMSCCYRKAELAGPTELGTLKIVDAGKVARATTGPSAASQPSGGPTVAMVLLDADRIQQDDELNVATIFHDGGGSKWGMLVVEGRAYDPGRPTGDNQLKKFGSVEATPEKAVDLGGGYKMISGKLKVPKWGPTGPVEGIDLSVRVRSANGDYSFVGLSVPVGKTHRALMVASAWPTMPLSWPDRQYGLGPLKVCNRAGRANAPAMDYRNLRVELSAEQVLPCVVGAGTISRVTQQGTYDICPATDGRGCADADDAVYTDHFLDQVLNDQTHLAVPTPIREQPTVEWKADLKVIDATGDAK